MSVLLCSTVRVVCDNYRTIQSCFIVRLANLVLVIILFIGTIVFSKLYKKVSHSGEDE